MQIRMLKNNKALFVVLVAIGIVTLAVLMNTRSTPEQAPLSERTYLARVIEVPSVDVIPRAMGYGNVAPSDVWDAVADVSGRVIEKHPNLRRGNVLPAGTVIVRIDPTEYELALAQIEADIRATTVQLGELEVKEANTRALLKIEQDGLRLSKREVERKRSLADRNTLSRSEYDKEQRNYLAQKQSVRSLQNTLELLPSERQLLEAQLARYQAKLNNARLDLQHTVIDLPFDARISSVRVERAQYVRQGDLLASADGIALAEISAQFPINRIRNIIRGKQKVNLETLERFSLAELLGLSARVWLRLDRYQIAWDGRVARFSDTIDPETRTAGVIVEVDEPYADIQPGIRPPLVKGMFVYVEMRGRKRSGQLVVPRSAVHGDELYLVDGENRLRKRKVEVGLADPEYMIVKSGIDRGERIVVSDLVPAIEGMLLRPVPDERVLERLIRAASGEAEPL